MFRKDNEKERYAFINNQIHTINVLPFENSTIFFLWDRFSCHIDLHLIIEVDVNGIPCFVCLFLIHQKITWKKENFTLKSLVRFFLSSTCTFKNKYNGETDCKSTYQNTKIRFIIETEREPKIQIELSLSKKSLFLNIILFVNFSSFSKLSVVSLLMQSRFSLRFFYHLERIVTKQSHL